jgi:hypothetical protein
LDAEVKRISWLNWCDGSVSEKPTGTGGVPRVAEIDSAASCVCVALRLQKELALVRSPKPRLPLMVRL